MVPIRFSVWSVTRFYVPLLLQAFSQSLTYPLVAGIVTHGAFGVNALTAFSQGQVIMFMIGALGGGLVMTGMVFARTWYGYVSFRRLNAIMMGVLLALQCVPTIAPFNRWLFEGFFALPPELAQTARWTLLFGVVMNASFFLRNVPMVVLFNNYESGKANNATFIRIAVTLACAALFPRLGWVGAGWGLFALTLGTCVELLVTWLYARPFVAKLPNRPGEVPLEDSKRTTTRWGDSKRTTTSEGLNLSTSQHLNLTWEQFRFTLPLSLGGFLLMLSPLIIAAFVGRTANSADMLAIHYVTLGVANPVAYAALRMQAVSIQFQPEYEGDRRLLVYSVFAGLCLGVIPFVFSLPAVGNWYFGHYQNVPERILDTARLAIFIYSFICIIHAVRGRIEGIAAARKRPRAVMAGQIAYTAGLFTTCAILLPLGVAGWAIAVSAIYFAPVCATAAIYATLHFAKGVTCNLRFSMFVVAVFALAAAGASAGVPERTMEVTGRWLQVPVVNAGKPCKVNVWDGGSNLFSFCVNAGTNAPDWFFPVHVEKLLVLQPLAFLMRPQCASVIRDRLDGVKSAVDETRGKVAVMEVEPSDVRALKSWFARRTPPRPPAPRSSKASAANSPTGSRNAPRRKFAHEENREYTKVRVGRMRRSHSRMRRAFGFR